jgi:hypothetical protein
MHASREAVAVYDARHRVPHVGGREARRAFLGTSGNGGRTEARQRAIRVFSGNPFPAAAPRSPPSGITRCAIPRTVPSREPPRERPRPSRRPRLRKIAHRVFVEAGSGVLAAGRRRRTGNEDGGIGISQKMRMAPCRASVPLPFPAPPRTCGATHACRRALTPFHCIGHPPRERDARFATRSALNRKREDAGHKRGLRSLLFPVRAKGCGEGLDILG